jgi:hypothetical protein
MMMVTIMMFFTVMSQCQGLATMTQTGQCGGRRRVRARAARLRAGSSLSSSCLPTVTVTVLHWAPALAEEGLDRGSFTVSSS